jgi:hypothetical protein
VNNHIISVNNDKTNNMVLYELLASRNTGKNSINQYKCILYCHYDMLRSSLDHHQVLMHVHHATITLANVLHAILSSYASFYKIIKSDYLKLFS